MGVIIFLHAIICICLVTVILMQSGRGGGLTEQFAAAESVFGAKTNAFMVRLTSILATLFFINCLTLAVMSSHKDKSLMMDRAKSAPVKTASESLLTPEALDNLKETSTAPVSEAVLLESSPNTTPAAVPAVETPEAPASSATEPVTNMTK